MQLMVDNVMWWTREAGCSHNRDGWVTEKGLNYFAFHHLDVEALIFWQNREHCFEDIISAKIVNIASRTWVWAMMGLSFEKKRVKVVRSRWTRQQFFKNNLRIKKRKSSNPNKMDIPCLGWHVNVFRAFLQTWIIQILKSVCMCCESWNSCQLFCQTARFVEFLQPIKDHHVPVVLGERFSFLLFNVSDSQRWDVLVQFIPVKNEFGGCRSFGIRGCLNMPSWRRDCQ